MEGLKERDLDENAQEISSSNNRRKIEISALTSEDTNKESQSHESNQDKSELRDWKRPRAEIIDSSSRSEGSKHCNNAFEAMLKAGLEGDVANADIYNAMLGLSRSNESDKFDDDISRNDINKYLTPGGHHNGGGASQSVAPSYLSNVNKRAPRVGPSYQAEI
jgi:hypothetical protein